MCILGFDIGGTKCTVSVHDANGREPGVQVVATAGPEQTLERLFREARGLLGGRTPRSAGVSCGGPLDTTHGLILSPPNLPGWDRIPILDRVHTRFACPATLMNDANAGALAEWRFGAGRGTRNLVFLTFGTGIGAGLILNGCLYEGQNGQAGEIGHVRLEHTGPVGYGKAGSVEGFCSGGGIAQIAREEARQHGGKVAFAPPDDSGESVQALHVGQAAENGDALACRILEEVGRNLGRALAVLVDVLNPERIVIGGIYPRCRRFLEPGIRETLDREALAEARSVCRIVPAELGERIGGFAPLAVALNARTEP